jgi:hypothetical protein
VEHNRIFPGKRCGKAGESGAGPAFRESSKENVEKSQEWFCSAVCQHGFHLDVYWAVPSREDTKVKDTRNPENGSDKGVLERRRREALKVLAGAGAGLTVVNWAKPVVQAVLVPAHAQMSPYNRTADSDGEFTVRLAAKSGRDDDSTA